MAYFLAFLGFVTLIVVHEGGHFLAAKAVGMRVERFSLFFGPMFAKRQIGETEYGIGVIPLGGYVKITGMAPGELYESPEVEARAYVNQPVWKRIVVISAGPAVNLLVAFLLAWLFFLGTRVHVVTNAQGVPLSSNLVGAITVGSPAQRVLKLGDQIVSVDGVHGSPQRIRDAIRTHTCAGDAHVNGCQAVMPVTMVIRRAGRLETVHVRPRWNSQVGAMLVGFAFAFRTAPNGVLYSAGHSATGLWHVTELTVSDIAQLFKARDRRQLHSIVGAYAITAQQIAAGWTNGVEVIAMISLSLAIINLFPLLPLDGGHIFWALAEKVRGRKVSLVVMERASLVGFALIGLLLVIGLSNDIHSIAGSGFGLQ
jgi:regulator of sigma E protease